MNPIRQNNINEIMKRDYVDLHKFSGTLGKNQRDSSKLNKQIMNVQHFRSSTNQMNLQNIQMKLEAHRMDLKPIEQEYNKLKGKSGTSKDHKRVQEISKKKAQQNDKIFATNLTKPELYQMIRNKQQQSEQDREIEQMWEKKLQNNPKIVQYDRQYHEYLLQKQAKSIMYDAVRQKLYRWDKYSQNQTFSASGNSVRKSKQKNRFNNFSSQLKNLRRIKAKQLGDTDQNNQQLQVSQIIQNPKSNSSNLKLSINNSKKVKSTKQQIFVSQYIFSQIDKGKKGLISKEEFLQWVKQNESMLAGYKIKHRWFYTDLDNFDTKRKSLLDTAELAMFLASLEKTQHPNDLDQIVGGIRKQQKKKIQISSKTKTHNIFEQFFPRKKSIFAQLFQTLDLNGDKILKREEFLQHIFIDQQCSKILDCVCIKIIPIQKEITFRDIFGYILDDFREERNSKIKKSKQFITFQRFCQYFQTPESIDISKLYRRTTKGLSAKEESQNQLTKQHLIFDISDSNLQVLHDLYNTIPRIYQDYIVTGDFIHLCERDPLVMSIEDQLCRGSSLETGLQIQSIKQCLKRIRVQCDQFICWKQCGQKKKKQRKNIKQNTNSQVKQATGGLVTFFSRRGRPVDWNQQFLKTKQKLREKQQLKNMKNNLFSKTMGTGTKDIIEIHQNGSPIKNRSKSNLKHKISQHIGLNYTIPVPFNITDELNKDNKVQKGKSQFDALNQKKDQLRNFVAKPVNKEILQPKPQLINGKVKNNQSFQNKYKYQNYENDRIQRALKKAEQEYLIAQAINKQKQQRKIKANTIGVDLTKKYHEILKENQRKSKIQSSKQIGSKKSKSNIQINQRLYPKSKADYQKKKLQKMKEKQRLAIEADLRKKQDQSQRIQNLKNKNKKQRQKAQELKKNKANDLQERQKMGLGDFKPKINKHELSEQEKQAIRNQKNARDLKKQEIERAKIIQYEKKRKHILEQNLKDPFLKIQNLQGGINNKQAVIENAYQIRLQQLLLPIKILGKQVDKKENIFKTFEKDHNFSMKTKKQRKIYLQGIANKFCIQMQNQQKFLNLIKIQQKQKNQKKSVQNELSRVKVNSNNQKLKNDMFFHKSKALKRYRAIIDGQSPSQVPSDFDQIAGDNSNQNQEKFGDQLQSVISQKQQ